MPLAEQSRSGPTQASALSAAHTPFDAFRHHPFRVAGRLCWFGLGIAFAIFDYVCRCAFRSNSARCAARARWLGRHSRFALRLFNIELQVDGQVPRHGLLVSNHLGYVDMLVLASLSPAVFVAKRDVKSWPVLGSLAQMAGTLFANRERRLQVGQTNVEIKAALVAGALVVIFPEGTSSNGSCVLPFKSALLEPAAAGLMIPTTVCHLQYSLDDGDAREEICYWGDHAFFPHLLNLFSKRGITAQAQFAEFRPGSDDRKALARHMREEILALKNAGTLVAGPRERDGDHHGTNRN
jgi:1-acyl-sn-glycerol-3-phosphate acyltransferase